jgi:hypothetical protein
MWTTERIVTLVVGILALVSLLVMTGAIYLVPNAFPVICVSVAVIWSLFVLVGSIFILRK